MSGPIRTQLGLTKKRLQGYIDELQRPPRPLVDDVLPIAEKLDNLHQLRNTYVYERARIHKTTNQIEELTKEWSAIMQGFDGAKLKLEEELYDKSIQATGNFMEVWNNGTEKLPWLDTLILEIDEFIRRISNENANNSRGLRDIDNVQSDLSQEGNNRNGQVSSEIQVRLPQLTPFFGDPLKWQEFWDSFESSVHTQSIPPVQKFNYLRTVLKGTALNAIEGIAVNNANYNEVIQILNKRFGDKDLIREVLYTNLRNLPVLHNNYRPFELRQLVDNIDKICRQLETQGESLNQHSLVGLIFERLPSSVVLKLEETYKKDSAWSVESLRDALYRFLSVQETVCRMTKMQVSNRGGLQPQPPNFRPGHYKSPAGPGVPRVPFSPRYRQPPQPLSSVDLFPVQSNVLQSQRRRISIPTRNNFRQNNRFSPRNGLSLASSPRLKSPCLMCQGNHYNDCCPVYNSLDARRNNIAQQNRCFVCLKVGHRSSRCMEPRRSCFHCQAFGQHSRVLCPSLFSHPRQSWRPTVQFTPDNVPVSASPANMPLPVVGRARPLPIQMKPISCDGQNPKPDPEECQNDKSHNDGHTKEVIVSDSDVKSSIVGYAGKQNNAFLMTATAYIQNPDLSSKPRRVRIFLDAGSQRTFITSRMSQKLNLPSSPAEQLTVHTFGSDFPHTMSSRIVNFDLFLKGGRKLSVQANTAKTLTGILKRTALSKDDISFLKQLSSKEHLADPLPVESEEFEPEVMLGLDYFWDVLEVGKKEGVLPSGLYLLKSKLGILIGGRRDDVSNEACMTSIHVNSATNCKEEKDLELFWALESIGIHDQPNANDDDEALQSFNESVQSVNGRYQVNWPWKTGAKLELPDNFQLAMNRFISLAKRLNSDKELLEKYNAVIQDQIAKGVIEPVDQDTKGGPVHHYLPHHPVITPQKTTTKVRVVYDASAKANFNSKSLNECLHRGPILLPDLCGLLMRFRLQPISVVADIEKAFLQISLNLADRDVTRFIWFSDPESGNLDKLRIYRFTHVTFGVISSPFLLNATISHHLQKSSLPVAKLINNNIYVDHIIVGAADVKAANEIYKEGKELFTSASMNLREWVANDRDFMNGIPEMDRGKGPVVKVLGISWDTESDKLSLGKIQTFEKETTTKREVLQTIASIFDPIGLLSACILLGKLFLKKLWDLKFDWDTILPQELYQEWMMLNHNFQGLNEFCLKRFIGLNPNKDTAENKLIVFVDASSLAYAAVVYLRTELENQVTINLIFAKSRLASKNTSLPRLELLAMVIGIRALSFVRKQLQLNIKSQMLFSDSECALHWLTSKKPLAVFVKNRIDEIKKHEDVSFQYINTLENPADIASRGTTFAELRNNKLWWNGPEWILKDESHWPKGNMPVLSTEMLRKISLEQRPTQPFFETHSAAAANIDEGSTELIQIGRFSSLSKMVMTILFVLRFLKIALWNKLESSIQEKYSKFDKIFKPFSTLNELASREEIRMCRILLDRIVQQRYFGDIFFSMDKLKSHPLARQLGLFVDTQDLLRCKGRLANAILPYQTKFPKLLPHGGPFTQMIIRQAHDRSGHSGVAQTLATTRREYWILKGRLAVKSLLRKCVTCQKILGGPYKLPLMPAIPANRVRESRPFQYVGLDYLGPIWIKLGLDKIKVWVCLFTCFVTRAIHLESVHDMSATQFLNTVRRFIARRGHPEKIVSDNAAQFKLVHKTIQTSNSQQFPSEDVIEYCSLKQISWNFISTYAPWQGGFYERMVGLVKSTLKKSIGRKLLTFSEFETMLCETEAIVNSRPLTYVNDDVSSLEILRPVDFLVPHGSVGTPQMEEDYDDPEYLPSIDSTQKLMQVWRKSQKTLDQFWHLWIRDYLINLRERYQTVHHAPKGASDLPPKVGDVVLVSEEYIQRGTWKMGRIVSLQKSHDDLVRSAEVHLHNGKTIRRPINLLYPVEVDDEVDDNEQTTEKNKDPGTSDNNGNMRKTRNTGKLLPSLTKSFLVGLILSSLILDCSADNKCPWMLKFPFRELSSEKCVSEGIVIFEQSDKTLCWSKRRCKRSWQQLDGKGECTNQTCACPNWAYKCSFYNNRLPNQPDNIDEILDEGKPNMCSFKPKDSCNTTPKKIQMLQIQLFNKSVFYIKALNIKWIRLSEDEFDCVGHGATSGTPAYCETHKCVKDATRFCYYRQNELAMYSNEKGSIPIKAYGQITTTIFDHKDVLKEAKTCIQCSLKCIKGGIQVELDDKMSLIQVCSAPFCYKLSFPKQKQDVQFPAEINLVEHDVRAKVWADGLLVKDFGIVCPSMPYCEMINCYICWERLMNPQCSVNFALLLIFLAIYFFSATIWLLFRLLKFLGYGSCQICNAVCKLTFCCLRLFKKARGKAYRTTVLPIYALIEEEKSSTDHLHGESEEITPLIMDTPSRKVTTLEKAREKWKKMKFSYYTNLSVIMIILLSSKGHCCSEVTSLTASQSTCSVTREKMMECVLNEVTRISLAPQGQTSCLLLNDPKGNPLGTLIIKVHRIGLTCHKRNEYYTRSYTMQHAAVKRCPTSGTCSGKKCKKIKTTSKIDELEGEPNNQPGFTYCSETCACWTCGCLFCTSGCMFYRTYAKPVTDYVYEVYTCPAWQYIVKVNVQLKTATDKKQHTFELTPGEMQKWKDMYSFDHHIHLLPSSANSK